MSGRLQDQVAIVTGAGQGIGAATAQRFAEEGARVAVAELNPDTGKATADGLCHAGYSAISVPTDVADEQAVQAMVEKVAKELGPPDILVNNAGIAIFNDPLALTDEEWRKCFAVDLDGVWYCSRAVLPYMLEKQHGSIVNIASVHSFQIIPRCFPYPVAKHGVVGLTRALAIEYAERGVRCNAVCPGYIATQVSIDYWDTFPDPVAERRRAENIHPMRRVGTPDEVAWSVVFLASDEAGFITGASLMVDGGRSVVYHD